MPVAAQRHGSIDPARQQRVAMSFDADADLLIVNPGRPNKSIPRGLFRSLFLEPLHMGAHFLSPTWQPTFRQSPDSPRVDSRVNRWIDRMHIDDLADATLNRLGRIQRQFARQSFDGPHQFVRRFQLVVVINVEVQEIESPAQIAPTPNSLTDPISKADTSKGE